LRIAIFVMIEDAGAPDGFDVIHDHFGFGGPAMADRLDVPRGRAVPNPMIYSSGGCGEPRALASA
jgi:hypothetical protein